ncbi:MAG: nicotinamide-nucleotide adenylyltransferase [Methanomassiliicoccales archaeon]
MRGLIVGRFQPFHLGHESAVMEVLSQCEEIVIAIGSAQYSHTQENPFTASERYEMIYAAMQDRNLQGRVHIVPVNDIHQNVLWVQHVRSTVPSFAVIYTNNPLTARLFREAGYEVGETRIYSREKYSGTIIREKMLKGGEWKDSVSNAVLLKIEEFDGVRRIRDIYSPSRTETTDVRNR